MSQNLSRRTLAKGAAWSVPAVAVAASAPMVAASPNNPCIKPSYTNDACKEPGRIAEYNLSFWLKNTCGTDDCYDVVVTDVRKSAGNDPILYTDQALTKPYTQDKAFKVCSDQPQRYDLPVTYSSNSANGIIVTYTVNGESFTETLPTPPDCA